MADLNLEVTYFETGGPHNTDKALEIAKKYSDKYGIKDIIVASTTGITAEKAAALFNVNNYNLVVITHSYYFAGPNKRQEFPEELMENLKKKGLKIFSGTHSMAAIERSIRISLKQWMPVEIMAKFWRVNFSQGVKVCMEIASMAVDAGLILDLDRDIICIGGTGSGADTVCLIRPATTSSFDKLRVKAILAKPL